MKTYRVAVLGCRARGSSIAYGYHLHPRTEIVGLCDVVPELLNDLGDSLGIERRFTDLDKMVSQTRPDIVVVATGTEYHYGLARRVLEHGCNLDVEKPMCPFLSEADDLIQLAERNRCRIAVHHQGRTAPTFKAVKSALEKGEIGSIRFIEASGKGYYGGYGLMNIGTHLINALLGIAGRCKRVSAYAQTGNLPVTPKDVIRSAQGMGVIAGEKITALLEFETGITAVLLQHRFDKINSMAHGIQIMGSNGHIRWNIRRAWIMPEPHPDPGDLDCKWQPIDLGSYLPELPAIPPEAKRPVEEYAYVDEYVSALDEERDHTCSGDEGRHVLEVIMAIFEAATTGITVGLPQTKRTHPLLEFAGLPNIGDLPAVARPYLEWLVVEDRRISRKGKGGR